MKTITNFINESSTLNIKNDNQMRKYLSNLGYGGLVDIKNEDDEVDGSYDPEDLGEFIASDAYEELANYLNKLADSNNRWAQEWHDFFYDMENMIGDMLN